LTRKSEIALCAIEKKQCRKAFPFLKSDILMGKMLMMIFLWMISDGQFFAADKSMDLFTYHQMYASVKFGV